MGRSLSLLGKPRKEIRRIRPQVREKATVRVHSHALLDMCA